MRTSLLRKPAARFYGLAFGTEMGMYARFEQRVTLGLLMVQSAVKVFEERYCT